MVDAASAAGMSQDHPGDPGTLLFENDRVRVWELVLRPGEICRWHVHELDHLLLVQDGCQIESITADGATGGFEIPDKLTLFIPGGTTPEIARNASPDRTLRELIIEFKDPKRAKSEVGMFSYFQPGTPTTAWLAELPHVKPA